MAFRFAARTLLELGKELISSDEVAIYELIKNSVDAQAGYASIRVEIIAKIVLQRRDFDLAIEALGRGEEPVDVLAKIVDALQVGAEQTRVAEFLNALREAVTNAKRFESALRLAYRRHNWIEVRDPGVGMSLAELDANFLTVGTRSRRADNIAGARYLGDKGVGRLATMRLGDRLSITTGQAGERRWNRLRIDWSRFSHDSDVELKDVDIEPFAGREKAADEHGTRVRISDLANDWVPERFAEMFAGQIARMVDPFEQGRGNRLLLVRYNGERVPVPSVPPALLDYAHATCRAEFRLEGSEPVIEGVVDYNRLGAKRAVSARGAEVFSLAQKSWKRRGKRGHAAFATAPLTLKALQAVGPFDVEVFWYNRLVVDGISGLTESQSQTREEIARWAGGPMLYRHGFRILPYGDPDDDWLELDLNAFGQSGFKLNRRQVLGRVRVSSSHAALSEQTNREGLIKSEPADALRTILLWLLHVELRQVINEADARERLRKRDTEQQARAYAGTVATLQAQLGELRAQAGEGHASLVTSIDTGVQNLVEQCELMLRNISARVEEVQEEREKFVQLAGIGLMTEFIFHELDRAVGATLRALADVGGRQREAALKSLTDQLTTLQKRISAFDELSGERRQSKSQFLVQDAVQVVLDSHRGQFARHDIRVRLIGETPSMRVRAVRGMFVQILENLVANAVYWLKQQADVEIGFEPRLWVTMDARSQTLAIADNGPGVDPRRREVIFQPFVTTKPVGQGRGLGLYISRELAAYHKWRLYADPDAEPKRPGRINTFVLDMSDDQ